MATETKPQAFSNNSLLGKLGILSLLAGLVLTCMSGYFHYNLSQFKKDGIEAQAIVTGSSISKSKWGTKTVTLFIAFETKEGKTINTEVKSPRDYNKHQASILYLSADPENVLHKEYLNPDNLGFWENLPLAIGILILGIVLCGFEFYRTRN